jgi:hypothetical protein
LFGLLSCQWFLHFLLGLGEGWFCFGALAGLAAIKAIERTSHHLKVLAAGEPIAAGLVVSLAQSLALSLACKFKFLILGLTRGDLLELLSPNAL